LGLVAQVEMLLATRLVLMARRRRSVHSSRRQVVAAVRGQGSLGTLVVRAVVARVAVSLVV
jgi:hypothetical protein